MAHPCGEDEKARNAHSPPFPAGTANSAGVTPVFRQWPLPFSIRTLHGKADPEVNHAGRTPAQGILRERNVHSWLPFNGLDAAQ